MLRPAPYPLSHNRMLLQACSNKQTGAVNRALSKMRIPVQAYRTYLFNLRSYADFQNLAFPRDISTAFGAALTELIVQGYILGATKSRKIRQAASRIAFSKLPSADDVVFSWDLASAKAVDSFTSSAFAIAQTLSTELRDSLQALAKDAFSQGLPFMQFKEQLAMQGFDTGNPYHLRTNFDTAANTAFAAGHWEQIKNNLELFPYLRYVALGNDRTCEICGPLDGLIYPHDDPFWDTWAPLNHWNCHCSVEQLTANEAEGSPKLNNPTDVMPKPQVGFDSNPAKLHYLPDTVRTSNPKLTDAKEARLPSVDAGAAWDKDQKINTNGMSKQELLDTYHSKIIEFHNKYEAPDKSVCLIVPTKEVLGKFDSNKYTLQDLRRRFQYLNYLPDIIQNPDEIWDRYINNKPRPHFIKVLDKNVVLVFEAVDGHYEYFNLMLLDQIDKIRNGILRYKK